MTGPRFRDVALTVCIAGCVPWLATAAEPEQVPVFVAVPEEPIVTEDDIAETYPLESDGSSSTPESVESSEETVFEEAPAVEESVSQGGVEADSPTSNADSAFDITSPSALAAPTAESPRSSLPSIDLPPAKPALGLPIELAEFEVAFMPIISVSEVGVRVSWACDKKNDLMDASINLAKAPMFEMTNRNFDTWRSQTKLLKKLMKQVGVNCAFGDDGEASVNQDLEKAFDAWTTLKESRG